MTAFLGMSQECMERLSPLPSLFLHDLSPLEGSKVSQVIFTQENVPLCSLGGKLLEPSKEE